MKIKIIGAGSMGHHLAYASRRMGWDATVIDNDPKALLRMKNEVYPARYGSWDESIKLFSPEEEPKGGFDIIAFGTPPDVTVKLAAKAFEEKPKLLHLEKPFCPPTLEGADELIAQINKNPETIVTVGYMYSVSEGIAAVAEILTSGKLGEILNLDVECREHWGQGVLKAHPWISGPWDTYLGYYKRGGGAACENSHGLHLWLYLADRMGWKGITDVKAAFSMRSENGSNYDGTAAFLLKEKSGRVGRVTQDTITSPTKFWLRAQGEKGFLEWYCRGVPEGDVVRWQEEGKEVQEKIFKKERADDFYRMVLHYKDLLDGSASVENSPLSFDRGYRVMKILSAAFKEEKLI
ncbi:hypothetical protein A3I27_02640 [Candidatus Giovannonibacteria bacterium RIFCSPLOWO2_02_FULL_43_11b]|uniref:GFO/IDH/MocA-like oxidoreductase domain-containing protein n=1 Tax=Candidatus Giovannonibacteria bacterium RIFCSPHIGHO2_12_FULL_43_15 TaxID=1798341 RepID=A0A1F5WP51_9BACT|nr:MAG: hypothetical protein A2739_03340 [Candidatus Giovannonibacteria bacterium RIFCSPHIGHO2_01_FULL_43_100]OGF66297.1 MAG: hypothetical protein A3B97_01835 [Candidatus Giovannonibacteria bacterium RIFCSPHIGHO2_02_FULL_43_32]OGF77367.1 MAG: hypothetical protein A3F23_00255 [Candidatus Giovannonibacteria bacterium RIFCSPHIGHO2_12_FULL_43_15]OGF79190.1 MAG: hypothetical protein A3A15_01020 [Candidatus Giovannonibacteria bacterium RIFCSPLOWO2_01_FULL_43_60]OGF90536.1 MAG: hypothetical protein A3